MATPEIKQLNPGDIGGRGCHPADPTGVIFGDHHWPLPQPHETKMAKGSKMPYMLIDVTTVEATKIKIIAHTHEAPLFAKILTKQGRTMIAPPVEGRGFSKLSLEQLQYLYWNHVQETPPTDFGELCQACLAIAQAMQVDSTPIETLEAEVHRLYPDEQAPQGSKTPREPKAPGAAPERPKATSTTGKVWEIADRVLTGTGHTKLGGIDLKDLRATIMTACTSEGINEATAATQYSKWKASKLLSASS